MAKVIVERPRLGLSWGAARPGRTRVVEDDDGEPTRAREPIDTLPRRTKALNENLSPLKRYLAKQVGRPWNKVYSEIAAHLKPASTVQQHVRDHLEDFVAVKTRMQNGAVYVQPRFGSPRPLAEDYCLFYVHPRTGLLKRNAKRRHGRGRNPMDAPHRRPGRYADQLYLKLDGAWWEVRLARNEAGLPCVDVVRRDGLSDLAPTQLYGRDDVYAAHKRALSRREKAALALDD